MSKGSFSLYGSLATLTLAVSLVFFASSASALPVGKGGQFYTLDKVRMIGKPIALPQHGQLSLAGYRKGAGKVFSLTEARQLSVPSVKELQLRAEGKPQDKELAAMLPLKGKQKMSTTMMKTAEKEEGVRLASLATLPREFMKRDKDYQWPLKLDDDQRITSPFGERKDPFTGKRAFHAGVDIAAPVGTPVLASAAGSVETVGTHARLGKYVKVKHDGVMSSVYGHMSATKVRKGQQVKAGQVIGAVGNTGRSTGPHLDFSLRKNGKPVNPIPQLELPDHLTTTQTARR